MARHRLSRRFKDGAQLVLGFVLPSFLIFVFVFGLQRRASRSRTDASNELYSSISNAIVSSISRTNDFRLAPLADLQYRKVNDVSSYTGWYETGPGFHRTWFHVTILQEGPPLKLSEVKFFDAKPDIRF